MITPVITKTILFALLSFFFPGFKIKGCKLNYLWITLGYMVLCFIGALLVSPVTYPLQWLASFIPFLGTIVIQISNFIVTFILSAIMLYILDKSTETLEIKDVSTIFTVSFILSVASVFF